MDDRRGGPRARRSSSGPPPSNVRSHAYAVVVQALGHGHRVEDALLVDPAAGEGEPQLVGVAAVPQRTADATSASVTRVSR